VKVWFRVAVSVGMALEAAGLAFWIAILLQVNGSNPFWTNFILTMLGWASLWYFPHSLSHFTVGSILGIKFRYFYVAESSLTKLDSPLLKRLGAMMPLAGVKIERRGFEDISPRRRAVMFLSGTLASLSLPFLCVYTLLLAGEELLILLITALLLGSTVFTLYFSSKAGDISKALDSLKSGGGP